jgi:RecB family endonuclease NucS
MDRQRRLPFEEEEQLDGLWLQLPEAERLKVVRLYGRLVAQAAGWRAEHTKREEGSHEHDDE